VKIKKRYDQRGHNVKPVKLAKPNLKGRRPGRVPVEPRLMRQHSRQIGPPKLMQAAPSPLARPRARGGRKPRSLV